ncbi:MAG: ABC transporter substrate-binding protein [Thiohalomonadales bacterium]
MRYFLHINIIVAVLLSGLGCEEKLVLTTSGVKLKVGVIVPITGSYAIIGQQGIEGLKAANQLQPILDNGDQIEFIIEDDQSDPEKSVAAMEKLANTDQVSAVILLSGSESALAVAKVANRYKTPIITSIATNPKITRDSHFLNQLAFDDDTQAVVAALFVRDELYIDRVAVFSDKENEYSNYLAKKFASKFKSVGGSVTDFISLTNDAPVNYREIIRKIRAKDPVLLYIPIKINSILAIAKTSKDQGWSPQMLATEGMLSLAIEEIKDDLALIDGMYATDMYSSDMDLSKYGEKIFSVIDSSKRTTYSLAAVEGYGYLFNAINNCESPRSRACINSAIRSSSNYTGITGIISIDADGEAERTLFINKIEGEQLKLVVRVN